MEEGLNVHAYSKEILENLETTLEQIVNLKGVEEYKIPYSELVTMMTRDPFIENKVLTYIDQSDMAPFLKLTTLNSFARDINKPGSKQ